MMENLYEYGFGEAYGAPNKPPRLETDICKLWISKFADFRKTINIGRGSYAMKHDVETWAGHYIPNGAFIQAAIELGFKYKENGPNAHFNISIKRAEKLGLIPSRWNHYSYISPGAGKEDSELVTLLNGDA